MKLVNEENIAMNHKKIIRIMKKYHLFVKIRRRNPYRMIMKRTNEHRIFDNLLNRQFRQKVPGRVLCTDISYLYYGAGRKAYISAIKDIASKEVLSWQVSNNLSMGFVLNTIDKLKNINTLSSDTIIHSDQGLHYTSPEYVKKIKEMKLIQSMSRKGNCIDNSPIESFFGHLKDDVDYRETKTFQEIETEINNYMEYYNNGRYQWDIKKMTPVQYRNHLLETT